MGSISIMPNNQLMLSVNWNTQRESNGCLSGEAIFSINTQHYLGPLCCKNLKQNLLHWKINSIIYSLIQKLLFLTYCKTSTAVIFRKFWYNFVNLWYHSLAYFSTKLSFSFVLFYIITSPLTSVRTRFIIYASQKVNTIIISVSLILLSKKTEFKSIKSIIWFRPFYWI